MAEEKILENWVRQYTNDLFNWAYHKTSDYQSAEDIVQETFLVAAENIERFRNESQPKTWLFGILKNKIAEHFRSKLKHPQIQIENEESFELFFDKNGSWNKSSRPDEWDINEDQLFDNGDFNKIFEHCMNNLPAQWFSCISMKYLEEKNSTLVCQELGLSTTNYWQILHRAKLQLRECLEQHWFHTKR
jgi:RNA polymerase sigma-70 factor (TIGR02943 family)